MPKNISEEVAHQMSKERPKTQSPLESAVNFSEVLFQKCLDAADDPRWCDFPSLALFRHIIQMADGIQILLAAGSSGPTLLLLRSMLESCISLKYIHLDDYRQRSLCWLCSYIHQKIDDMELRDKDTPSGREFLETVAKEEEKLSPTLASLSSPYRRDVARLLDRLRQPDLAEIEKKYEHLKQGGKAGGKRKNIPPKWHTLYDSQIGGARKLADAVGMLTEYKLVYQRWSATVHGTDASRLLQKQEDGGTGFAPLRSPKFAKHAERGAGHFLNSGQHVMVEKFLPGKPEEVLAKWYSEVAQPEREPDWS